MFCVLYIKPDTEPCLNGYASPNALTKTFRNEIHFLTTRGANHVLSIIRDIHKQFRILNCARHVMKGWTFEDLPRQPPSLRNLSYIL